MTMSNPERDPLTSYRLGAVRVGVNVTLLALVILIGFRLIPGHGTAPLLPYAAVLATALIGAVGVHMLPWERLFASDLGIRAMYVWSVLDILLVAMAVWVTGAGRSDLFVLYGLTTVFFGASYPPRGQVGLLAFTFACYLAILGATGWHVGAAIVFLRCGVLGILAVLVSFLSAQLIGHIGSLQEARSRAERWAGLLSAVAGSARRMTLDREAILEEIVDGAMGLGFEAAAVCAYDHEASTFVVTNHRSLPDGYVGSLHSTRADLPGLVRDRGRTVVLDRAHRPDDPGALPLLQEGFGAFIASPIWADGWLVAALVGCAREDRPISPQEIEAFELLAAQAGLALQNAQRFEETLHTVERLEELDKLKDDFLATASHELRTPLTVILGSGLILEQSPETLDGATRRELLSGVTRNARTLERLIASLLDFAQLGADSVRMATQAFDVREALRAVTGRFGHLFDDGCLTVDAGEGLLAQGDPMLIERVLDNLVSNAAKHTPSGTPVRLSGRTEGLHVLIAVEDEGPGISPDDLHHLGERFFRGGDLNARSTKGLGLGLALVREILDLHGTQLEIQSEVGSGSRFTFRLRVAEPPELDDLEELEQMRGTAP
jgi:signal transduction histidine kinase